MTNFDMFATLAAMKRHSVAVIDPVEFCKAMADSTRQAILRLLQVRGAITVGEIVAAFKLSQPTISHHLAILRRHGLVQTEPRGKEVYYRMDQENVTECCGMLMSRFSVVLHKDIEVKSQ